MFDSEYDLAETASSSAEIFLFQKKTQETTKPGSESQIASFQETVLGFVLTMVVIVLADSKLEKLMLMR